jgi:hypothetical protein
LIDGAAAPEPVSVHFNVGHPEVVLPADIAEVGLGQPISDGKAVAVGGERARKIALRQLHIADPLVRYRQVQPALPG